MMNWQNSSGQLLKLKASALLLLLPAATYPLVAQVSTGELRLRATDPTGLGLKATVMVSAGANQFQRTITTNNEGEVDVKTLAYGIYSVQASRTGFATTEEMVDVRSEVPTELVTRLPVASVSALLNVDGSAPLIDPYRPSSVMGIGARQINDRVGPLRVGRVQDMVNSQPGWLYVVNSVLHPRGSEYQTQFVVDGIPLTDNRSPGFGPEIEADDLESLNVYTAGIPAEYGRKMGGVVELNTRRETAGRHGRVVLSGGSYDTGSAYAAGQDLWGKNLLE